MKQKKNNLPLFDRTIRFFAISADTYWQARAEETQNAILAYILAANTDTAFAKEYGVNGKEDYAEFRKRIPVFSYEKIFPYIERMMKGERDVLTSFPVDEFAKSSGTTSGRSKYIPTPSAYMRGNHQKAGYDMITAYARAHEDTNIFSGKAVMVAGSIAPIPNGVGEAGDISALIMRAMPFWTGHARPYTKSVALGPSWPEKAKEIAEVSAGENIVSLCGTPTWMLEILELAKKKSGAKTLRQLWPNLEVFFHGAISFAPYRKTYEALVGQPGIEFREVYNASEGVFAFEDEPVDHPGELLLCTDHDIFYEFIPVVDCIPEGESVPLPDVKPDVPYAMLITTTGGLWRYMIGDVVTFTSTDPYRLKIVGRTTQFINAFGEEVIADNATAAIAEAAEATGAEVQAFTAAATFSAKPAQGAHEWAVEFRIEPKDIAAFTHALDQALKKENSDYEAKRAEDIVLGAPILHKVPEGTFRRHLESQGKLGGQHKVPLLSNERAVIEAILRLTK